MANGETPPPDPTAQELIELAREIRERVRSRHPTHAPGGVALPDLMPLLHARDAAEGKVASIGTVNPRPPGALNSLIQLLKRLAARLLDWHVREQVEFNRSVVRALSATLEALDENNRALARIAETAALVNPIREALDENNRALARIAEAAALGRDVAAHWAQWRPAWEEKLEKSEIHALRALAELQGVVQQRLAQLEISFRDLTRRQHEEFRLSAERSALEIQQRLWRDLEKVRIEFERLIHSELRLLRQRAARLDPIAPPAAPVVQASEPPVGPLAFALRFRGSEEEIRRRQTFYLPYFRRAGQVLDLACGRGEFLELLREAGVNARGVDLDPACVEICRAKGLDVEQRGAFDCLEQLPPSTLDAIFCSHFVEHLLAAQVPELIRLASSRLVPGGLLAVETPNPQCLATLAAAFYADPTHQRPLPAPLLRFYFEEAGFGGIEVHPLSPASEVYPELAALPDAFRDAFFGGMDYAILGRRL